MLQCAGFSKTPNRLTTGIVLDVSMVNVMDVVESFDAWQFSKF